ncbi:Hypothetical Protein FCC1311_107202 [Hondaea fermentalgiana]|uniref:Uncharacterized protein n=1 Tax=Hondaea fermentalgiana TaxID=2315210 RepID=A0A2R5GUE4_9STRA|nr:Hypothetical Protein FCC1311_107202 [Hondaea fermentalgiana]|eukprot:GBG34496.1 Hypothetical Protein FCC1311_107202 [Hondaea fermentalgiana]
MGERRGPGTFQLGRAAGDPLGDGKVKTVPVNLLNRHTKRVLGKPEGWDTSEVGRIRNLDQGRASMYNARRDQRQETSDFELPPGSLLLKSPYKPSISTRSGGAGQRAGVGPGSVTGSSSLGFGRGEDEDAEGGLGLETDQSSRLPGRRAITQHYRALLLGEDFDDWSSGPLDNARPGTADSRPTFAAGQSSRRTRAEDFLRPAKPSKNENKLLSKYKANIVPRGMKRPPHTYFTELGPPQQQQSQQQQQQKNMPPHHGQNQEQYAQDGQYGDRTMDAAQNAANKEWESHLRAPRTADYTARYFQYGDEDKPTNASSKASVPNGSSHAISGDDEEEAEDEEEEEEEEDDDEEESEDEEDEDEEDHVGDMQDSATPSHQPGRGSGDAHLAAKYVDIISQLTSELERAQNRIADMEREREEEQEELESELEELDKGNLDLKGQTVALQRQVLRLTAERQENLESIREQQEANDKLRADYQKMEEIAKVLHQKATVLQKKLAQKDDRSVERAAERKVRGLAGGSSFPVETLEDAMDRIAELETLNEALRTGLAQSRAPPRSS